ncbi:MAG: hypothetical protein N3J91_12395 [Verrucomicrobiae bacterium]|nr:hypothetical protein [Verrucomicrobiae bacterium]
MIPQVQGGLRLQLNLRIVGYFADLVPGQSHAGVNRDGHGQPAGGAQDELVETMHGGKLREWGMRVHPPVNGLGHSPVGSPNYVMVLRKMVKYIRKMVLIFNRFELLNFINILLPTRLVTRALFAHQVTGWAEEVGVTTNCAWCL